MVAIAMPLAAPMPVHRARKGEMKCVDVLCVPFVPSAHDSKPAVLPVRLRPELLAPELGRHSADAAVRRFFYGCKKETGEGRRKNQS